MFSNKDKDFYKNFSFAEAINRIEHNNVTGLYREMDKEGKKHFKSTGIHAEGNLTIPYQALAQRDLTVGTDDQGGYTVGTNLLAGSFIEMLNNAMKVKTMGATWLDNLTGDVAIPKQASGTTAAWEGENDENSEGSATFGQVSLSPNRIGCYTEVSKQLNVQSSLSIDHLVKQILANSIAEAIDLAALHGTGSGNQPLGIAGTSGVGNVAGGTNGLIPTYGNIIELESALAESNAIINDKTTGYLTNAKVRGILKQVFTNATYGEHTVWDVSKPSEPQLNGYRAEVSNQVADDLTKGSSSGVCSAIFFGDWSQLIVGMWGGLDIVVDPYTLATTNKTRITANAYADVGIRNSQSFAVMLDCLT